MKRFYILTEELNMHHPNDCIDGIELGGLVGLKSGTYALESDIMELKDSYIAFRKLKNPHSEGNWYIPTRFLVFEKETVTIEI